MVGEPLFECFLDRIRVLTESAAVGFSNNIALEFSQPKALPNRGAIWHTHGSLDPTQDHISPYQIANLDALNGLNIGSFT
jgi:hypothetical protein